MLIARFILNKQNHFIKSVFLGIKNIFFFLGGFDKKLRPQNRLNTQRGHFMHHGHRATDVVGIGDRYGRHFIVRRPFGKFGHFNRPFQQGIGRVHM